ncbi:MAG: hypothetical protein KC592_09540 [Nitrospira sp.]|nr:hypothetical protein [Nitrospira sp.]
MMQWQKNFLTRFVAGLFLILGASPLPIAGATDEPVVGQLSEECTVDDAKGTFKTIDSRYTIHGTCKVFEEFKGNKKITAAYEWTAQGSYHTENKATSETLAIFNTISRSAAGSVTSTMQCDTDPWRLASASPCRSIVSQPSKDFPTLIYYNLSEYAHGMPLSSLLSPSQRSALNKQYTISRASRQKPGAGGPVVSRPPSPLVNPPPSGEGAPSAFEEVLKITKPAAGTTIVHGQLVVQAQPPRVGGSPVTELEFTWLDAPINQPYVNAYPIDTAKLIQGYVVDPKVTRIQLGRWQVRARVSGRAVPGPWSLAVPFQLVLSQPTQSKPSPPSGFLKKQSPQSDFSIQQTPKKGMSEEPQIFLPQTRPSQGFGGTEFLRSRGIEENDSKDSASDPEKKP